MEEAGFTFAGSLTLDWSSVLSGGVSRRASTRSLLDLNMTADFEKVAGLKGGKAYVDFYSTDGRGGSDFVGDAQGVSNIQTDENVHQIAEVWYEQTAFDGLLRVKAGKIEANSEFVFLDSAGEFINSSAGVTPTVFTLPTYPDPAFGAVAFVYPTDWLYAGLGFFDGSGIRVATGSRGPRPLFHTADYFYIGEVGATWDGVGSLAGGRACVGGWYHTGEFAKFDGGSVNGTGGVYVLGEQHLLRRDPANEKDDKGLFVFVQCSVADDAVSDIGMHIGAGLSLAGTFPGRDDDAAGVYVSWVDLSDKDGAGYTKDEVAVELFYKATVMPCFTVKPDLQIVSNPSGAEDIDTAIVGAVRFEITF